MASHRLGRHGVSESSFLGGTFFCRSESMLKVGGCKQVAYTLPLFLNQVFV
jgi:hypothetical protein